MNNKLTESELKQLKEIHSKYNGSLFDLGQLELQFAVLEGKKNEILSLIADLQSDQNKLAKDLQSKYGEGEINLNTGEIIKK